MPVTTLYAGLLGLFYVALAANVIRTRVALQVNLGDGGQEILQRRIRAHGNFAEYVPLALLLLAFLESGGRPDWVIHGLGGLLLAGRLAHAYALSSSSRRPAARVGGMVATLSVIASAALGCLARALS